MARPKTREEREQETMNAIESWLPKTDIGKSVKNKEITSMNNLLKMGVNVLESQIVDILLPNLESDLIAIGQSKGKFGGGKRSTWKQTQKKTKEGNKPKFTAVAVVGNKDGFIGIGRGKAKETVPAREKATRAAKLNLIAIRRGSGSWKSEIGGTYSIPYAVEGKCGSVKVVLKPAPKGTGIVAEKECAKMLKLAGIDNVYQKSFGSTKTKINLIYACFDALKQLTKVKLTHTYEQTSGVTTGNDNQ